MARAAAGLVGRIALTARSRSVVALDADRSAIARVSCDHPARRGDPATETADPNARQHAASAAAIPAGTQSRWGATARAIHRILGDSLVAERCFAASAPLCRVLPVARGDA